MMSYDALSLSAFDSLEFITSMNPLDILIDTYSCSVPGLMEARTLYCLCKCEPALHPRIRRAHTRKDWQTENLEVWAYSATFWCSLKVCIHPFWSNNVINVGVFLWDWKCKGQNIDTYILEQCMISTRSPNDFSIRQHIMCMQADDDDDDDSLPFSHILLLKLLWVTQCVSHYLSDTANSGAFLCWRGIQRSFERTWMARDRSGICCWGWFQLHGNEWPGCSRGGGATWWQSACCCAWERCTTLCLIGWEQYACTLVVTMINSSTPVHLHASLEPVVDCSLWTWYV